MACALRCGASDAHTPPQVARFCSEAAVQTDLHGVHVSLGEAGLGHVVSRQGGQLRPPPIGGSGSDCGEVEVAGAQQIAHSLLEALAVLAIGRAHDSAGAGTGTSAP